MNLMRSMLFALLILFSMPVHADGDPFIIHDYQICNFLAQKCKFDIQKRWNDIFESASFESRDSLSKKERDALYQLRKEVSRAIGVYCNREFGIDAGVQFDYGSDLGAAREWINDLISPEIRPDSFIKTTVDQQKDMEARVAAIAQILFQKYDSEDDETCKYFYLDRLTKKSFLEQIFVVIESFLSEQNINHRLEEEGVPRCFVQRFPMMSVIVDHSEDGSVMMTGYPSTTLTTEVENEPVLLDYPYLFYRELESTSFWKKALCLSALGLVAGSGAYWAYNNFEIGWRDSVENECGDGITGPGCENAFALGTRGYKSSAPSYDAVLSNQESWLVVNDGGQGYMNEPTGSVAVIGGKHDNGVPRPPLQYDGAVGHHQYYIGRLASGQWDCPSGKSAFYFLPDGRLCYFNKAVVRAGVEEPFCDPNQKICELPDGLLLYQQDGQWLLRPSCQKEKGICHVDEKNTVYHYAPTDVWTRRNPCKVTEEVCVFKDDIMYWNEATFEWQRTPADNCNQDKVMCKFSNGVRIFYNKSDDTWSLNVPCSQADGICHLPETTLYWHASDNQWKEEVPCNPQEVVCKFQNGEMLYWDTQSSSWTKIALTTEATDAAQLPGNMVLYYDAAQEKWVTEEPENFNGKSCIFLNNGRQLLFDPETNQWQEGLFCEFPAKEISIEEALEETSFRNYETSEQGYPGADDQVGILFSQDQQNLGDLQDIDNQHVEVYRQTFEQNDVQVDSNQFGEEIVPQDSLQTGDNENSEQSFHESAECSQDQRVLARPQNQDQDLEEVSEQNDVQVASNQVA